MKVIATIDRWDLLRLNLYLLPRAKANRIFVCVVALAVFVSHWTSHEGPISAREVAVFLASGIAGGLVGLLAGTVICMIMMMLPSEQREGVLGEHEFEIRQDGFFERTKANEAINRWGGIRSINKTGSAIYVGLGGYLFHIIPKRAFSDLAAFDEYFESLCKNWRLVD